ncbi:kinase-like protein [Basidiobolus meristosporus CBS 931.73]|uniref:non-specific serine/threonine protein kinase n=1 Tax=Basidiobolus meristosporus CBS 931.73 TaxID=1314790 RepID=A0A1Y1YSB7_9FUNG|nr:kinase-like protein [Basidiobolus meristosporus CBS 931.73]|eukprot:ORY00923.1 kinase-like protein [Basidiobolus meristosporus CBS 931.73]
MSLPRPENASQYQDRIPTPFLGSKESLTYLDTLLDTFLAMYEDCDTIDLSGIEDTQACLSNSISIASRLDALRPHKSEYEMLKPLAQGEFGMVSVVRKKSTGDVYAMKTMHKQYILRRREQAFYMEERDILARGRGSWWIPNLHSAFQDHENLYLVMEYVPGGDLFSLLAKRDEPILDEQAARFYIAEVILALEELHALGYAHRDIKPSNILIDRTGHIKLADFGSSIQIGPFNKITSSVPVGTCDYISPEILQAQESSHDSYGKECDWWSVGIVLYEMLQGDPPFYSESVIETYSRIMRPQDELQFVEDIPLSTTAQDLIRRLLCIKENRLGSNGVEEIKRHPFFAGYQWNNRALETPPYIPTSESPFDTGNFLPMEDAQKPIAISNNDRDLVGKYFPFIGFTYHFGNTKNFDTDTQAYCLSIPAGLVKDKIPEKEKSNLEQAIESRKLYYQTFRDENSRLRVQALSWKNTTPTCSISSRDFSGVRSSTSTISALKQKYFENEVALLNTFLEELDYQLHEYCLEREQSLLLKDAESRTERSSLDSLNTEQSNIDDIGLLAGSIDVGKPHKLHLGSRNAIPESNPKYGPHLDTAHCKSEEQTKLTKTSNLMNEVHQSSIRANEAVIYPQDLNRVLEAKLSTVYGKVGRYYNQISIEAVLRNNTVGEVDQLLLGKAIISLKHNTNLSNRAYHHTSEREVKNCGVHDLANEQIKQAFRVPDLERYI